MQRGNDEQNVWQNQKYIYSHHKHTMKGFNWLETYLYWSPCVFISQDFDELAVFVDLFTHTVEHAHLLQFLAQVLDRCIK